MRSTLAIIFALIILLAGYTIWPFYSLYRIASAVETRNSAALQELVDFPSLRVSMAQQIANAHLKLTCKSADTYATLYLTHDSVPRFFNSANARPARRPSLVAVESSSLA